MFKWTKKIRTKLIRIHYISNASIFGASKIFPLSHPIAFWDHLNNFRHRISAVGCSKSTISLNILLIFDNVRHRYNEKNFERHHQLFQRFRNDQGYEIWVSFLSGPKTYNLHISNIDAIFGALFTLKIQQEYTQT